MSRYGKILRSIAGQQLQHDVGLALYTAAQRVEVESRISLTTGAVSGKNHVPSSPGQAPNNDTGILAASHETELLAWDHARVSVNAPYASALEVGTLRMAARPYLGPATRKTRKAMTKLITRAIKTAMARAERSVP